MLSSRASKKVPLIARPAFFRALSSSNAFLEKPFPPRIVVSEADMTESFLKGTGPGGQKINKTSSAVQLKHLPTGIVVKCQETRSREQNRRTARRILGEKLEDMEKGPLSRTALKAERERKKKASAAKKSKRKYRKLDEEGKEGSGDAVEQEEQDDSVGEGTSQHGTPNELDNSSQAGNKDG